jgi:hypothetical protein
MLTKTGCDLRLIAAIATLLGVACPEASADQQPAARTAPAIQGSVDIRDGRQARFRYYFDHNALKDCIRVEHSLIALTESGNLIRFDAETLAMEGQAIIPGRGTAIAPDNDRVLVGTQDGKIYDVDPASLSLKVVATVQGRVAWLFADGLGNTQHGKIVAVVDNFPEVLPFPGEPFKGYDARSARLEKIETRPYFVAVYANGKVRTLPFQLGKNFAIPNSYLLDNSNRLWMGTDKGEWGGECSYMDLRTGKVHAVAGDVSGVLGFLRSTDGRLFSYGGTSHLGMHTGYIAQITDEHLDNIIRFESNDWKQPVPAQAQQVISQLKKATEAQGQTVSPDDKPQAPIDLMVEDSDKAGFWIVSAHTLYRTDSRLSEWSKIVDLEGRWYGGRRYAMGNTPTVNRLIADKSNPDSLLVAMGRDGLERVSDARVEHLPFIGELESSVIDIWKTSIGTVLLADDSDHAAWRVANDGWQQMRFFPNRRPSDEGADWYEAEPFGDDGDGIIAFSNDNISPGERDIIKLRTPGTAETTESWKDSSSRWDSSFLRPSDGHLLRISGSKLEIRQPSGWQETGESKLPDSDERKRVLIGRRYISLAEVHQSEIFLDVELGDLDKLTRTSDGRYVFAPLSYKGRAVPTGVFDAVADSDGWVLLATADGLFRLRLENGERKSIPSPSLSEEIKSICRDGRGRLWAAGKRLYLSSDDGKRWNNVELPMLSDTYTKRVRPNAMAPGLIVALPDRGVVFLDW